MRCHRDAGQTSTSYLGTILVVGAIIGALLVVGGIPQTVAEALERAICSVSGGTDCGAAESAGPEATPTTAELAARREAVAPFVHEQGGQLEDLLDQADEALDRGDAEEADEILDQIELYEDLADGGRGEIITDLVSPSNQEFADMVDEGTTYRDDGADNVRYFEVPPAPGDGVLVHDFFIRHANSLGLRGDDRGPEDPVLGDLDVENSRVIVVVDRESGRGAVIQSETCTVEVFGGDACNEPRPIVFDIGDNWENDSENDITGEGINIDETNQFDFTVEDDSVSLTYDALNSITPLVISVDGTITLERGDDGWYVITEDTRDNYPARNIYQYRPGEDPHQIDYDEGEGMVGAVPHCDLPDLPGRLPNLPSVPGPC